MEIDERANESQVRLPRGDALVICLVEKPTTGFRWSLTCTAEPMLVSLGDETVPPDAAQDGAQGGSGWRRWRFLADAPGTGTVELAYRRSWEQNAPPAQAFRVFVQVI